jgi:Zn-finger nucleic acid-binding protein
MKCPRDGKTLDDIVISGSQVDRCEECGGIWFDRDELEKIKDERDENLSWLDFDLWRDEEKLKAGGTYIDCPRDGSPLYQIQYGESSVMADVCPQCRGVWLDRDELEKLIADLEAKINSETLPQYLADLEMEFKNLLFEHSKKDARNIAIIAKLISYRLLAQHPRIMEIISSLPD